MKSMTKMISLVRTMCVTAIVSLLTQSVWAAVTPDFLYTGSGNGSTTGWFTGWDGEGFANNRRAIGPGNMGLVFAADHVNNNIKWHPWKNYQVPATFSIALYTDLSVVSNPDTETAALLAAGGNSGNRAIIYKRGNKVGLATNGGDVETDIPTGGGYHLYTVTYTSDKITIAIDNGTPVEKTGTFARPNNGFQIGGIYGGVGSWSNPRGLPVAAVVGFGHVLTADEMTELTTTYPATAETTLTSELAYNQNGGIIYAGTITHNSKLSIKRGMLTIPAGADCKVKAIDFGDTQGSDGTFGLELDGALTITGESSKSDANQGNNSVKKAYTSGEGGFLGGDWEGSGTYNIRGTLTIADSYMQPIHDAGMQTYNIENGGELIVKGIQAGTFHTKSTPQHVFNVKNGGLLKVTTALSLGTLNASVEEGGVLELANYGNDDFYNSNISGLTVDGKLKFTGSNFVKLPADDTKLAKLATFAEIENDLANGMLMTDAKTYAIGSLSGTGKFRYDWGSDARTLVVKQSKTTTWSGGIFDASGHASSSRALNIVVQSENNAILEVTGTLNSSTTTLTAGAGGTIDINGSCNATTVILNGGKIRTKGVGNAHGTMVRNLKLDQDGAYEWSGEGSGFIGIGASEKDSKLDLNGHKLTLTGKDSSTRVYLDKVTSFPNAGTIEVTKGKLFIHCASINAPEGTKLVIGTEASIEADNQTLSVTELVCNGTATTTASDMCMVTATKKVSGTGSIPKLTIGEGATVDGSLTITTTVVFGNTIKLAEGATISIPAETTSLPLVLAEDGTIRGVLTANGTIDATVKVSQFTVTTVKLADGVTLILDAVAADGTTVSSAGTIKIADPNLGWAASVNKNTILSNKNITLGEGTSAPSYWYEVGGAKADSYFGRQASYWTNVFGGPTATALEASTPTEAQWRELAVAGDVPQYYDSNQGGTCNNWAPILLDGNLMPYVKAADGYKTLKSDFYNGWNIRLALVNGVMLEMQALGKLQGGQPKFIGVDATSKLIIDSYQNGNNNGTIAFDIASAEGLTVNSDMLAEGNQNEGQFEYTFHGNGSIKVAGAFNLGASHTVKSADIELGTGAYKTILRKQLISFAGTEMTSDKFSLTAVNVTDDSGVSGTVIPSTSLLDASSDFGTARLAVDQTGVYIEYVGRHNGLPPYYQWKFGKKNAAWGDSEGAWQGLFDTATPSLKVWSEDRPKTSSSESNDLLNYAKDFVFIFDAATSDSVVVDAALPASRTHTYDGVEGVGYRRVKVTNTNKDADTVETFSFNLPQIEGVDSKGAPLSTFDFSTYNVEMAAPIDATTFNGELGLRAKLTGPITLGPQTKIVFIAPEGEETIAYDYDIRGCEGSVEVSGPGTFIVPNTMTGIPFEKTNGGSLKYDIPEGQTVTAAAISGNGGVIKAGAGTLKITEEASFTGALQINEGAVEVIAPSQDSPHAAIRVTVSEGAAMRLVITDLEKDYEAKGITGTVVFVNEDGDVLASEGYKYTGTASVAKVGSTNYSSLNVAFEAAKNDVSKTVTLIKGCGQAAEIPAGVTLDTNGKVFEGAVTGSGTILFKDSAPTAAALGKNAFTAEGWTGTVWLKNIGNTNINANQPLVAAGILMKLGNANSTLKLTDCRGYNNDDTNEYPFALELEDGECVNENSHYGWTNVSGYSSRTHTFKALKGTGTYIGTFCEEVEKFRTIEDFEGTLMINAYRGKKIVVGDVNAGGNGTLVLADGAKLKHAFTVKANGVTFGDTVILGSEISSVGSVVMTCPQPATIPSISGDNMLVYEDGALKVIATVAKIGEKKFATLADAIAALTAEQDVTAITLNGTSIVSLPEGYEDFAINGTSIVKKPRYTITVNKDEHILATTIPASVRNDIGTISFTVETEINHHVVSVVANGAELSAVDGVYTLNMTEDTSVVITSAIDTYKVSVSDLDNATYTISGPHTSNDDGTISVDYGETITVTYTPNTNYDLYNGEVKVTDGSITATVTSDMVITPSFEAKKGVVTIVIPPAPVGTIVTVTVDGINTHFNELGNVAGVEIGSTVVVTYSAADGYIMEPVSTTLTAGESTEITVPTAAPVKAVAMIGTTLYPTLAAAFAVGGDVTLLQNTTETLTIVAGKSVTLDLNGKTITSAANTITVKGALVVNGAAGGIASTGSGKSAITTSGSGTFTINGGAITAVGTAVSGVGTITGGTITSSGSFAVYANSSSGSIVITGGTITGTAEKGDVGVYTGNVKVTGATLTNGIKFASNASGIILAGTDTTLFTPELGIYDGETLVGYAPAQTTSTISAMAGKTVKLLKDCTTTDYLTIGKSCTLDLNGYNLTTSAAAAIVVKGTSATPSVVTITGTGSGKVSSTAADCNAVQIGAYATLTIAGGEYVVPTDNSAIYIATSYAAKPSTVTITGGTFASGDGKYVLNIKDDQVARGAAISVTGGTFKGFDPSNCISEGAGTNFVADGYESVKGNDDCYYVQIKPETPVVPEVTTTETTITPVVPQGGSVEVITPDGATLTGSDAVISTAYVDTAALFTVITTTAEGVKTVANVGVINAKAEEANKVTTAVAVPFTGATVANLLNTALLTKDDMLMAYLDGSYKSWKLTAEKTWTPATTVKSGEQIDAPQAEDAALQRGSAVWVTTAGKVVVLGKYDEKTEIVEPTTPETHILANPTMKPYTPSVKAGDAQDQVIEIGTAKPTRYTKKNGKWTAPIVVEHDDFFGDIVEEQQVNPVIPVGKGFWFIKK